MAEDLNSPSLGEAQPETAQPVPQPEPQPARRPPLLESESPSRYKGRFRFVYLILILGLAGAIAGAVIIATQKSSSAHSSAGGQEVTWTPSSGNEQSVAHQIASKVTSEYSRLGDFAHVFSQNPLQLQPPVVAIEVRSQFGVLNLPRKSSLQLTSKSWLYEICGATQACGLAPTGPESGAKFGRRVGQEMMELALYTFKYLPRIQSVIVLLPPSSSSNSTSFALYVNRGSVGPLLSMPLREAIGKPGSPLHDVLGRVQSHLYQWDPNQVQQLPDQSWILPLNQPPGSFGSG
jgi:hypothetical protein